jgi:hypothetical protein
VLVLDAPLITLTSPLAPPTPPPELMSTDPVAQLALLPLDNFKSPPQPDDPAPAHRAASPPDPVIVPLEQIMLLPPGELVFTATLVASKPSPTPTCRQPVLTPVEPPLSILV